ncbi:hypothetical protein GZL_05340 [Streptomyces sp. 769]|nr:hypothetical protein GZL_05340 [Streptomyces sp. 769]
MTALGGAAHRGPLLPCGGVADRDAYTCSRHDSVHTLARAVAGRNGVSRSVGRRRADDGTLRTGRRGGRLSVVRRKVVNPGPFAPVGAVEGVSDRSRCSPRWDGTFS